jgi:hypothetical protein
MLPVPHVLASFLPFVPQWLKDWGGKHGKFHKTCCLTQLTAHNRIA